MKTKITKRKKATVAPRPCLSAMFSYLLFFKRGHGILNFTDEYLTPSNPKAYIKSAFDAEFFLFAEHYDFYLRYKNHRKCLKTSDFEEEKNFSRAVKKCEKSKGLGLVFR